MRVFSSFFLLAEFHQSIDHIQNIKQMADIDIASPQLNNSINQSPVVYLITNNNNNNTNNTTETTNQHHQSGGGVQNDDYDDGNSTARLFERTRIQVLAVERELVQKKTFTKWINSHLIRSGYSNQYRVSDLYIDLRDGRVLIRLVEREKKTLFLYFSIIYFYVFLRNLLIFFYFLYCVHFPEFNFSSICIVIFC